jgi:diguanylate cyclase (GGDEF)-like protein
MNQENPNLHNDSVLTREKDARELAYLHLFHCCQQLSAAVDQAKIIEIILEYFDRELRPAASRIYIGQMPLPKSFDVIEQRGLSQRVFVFQFQCVGDTTYVYRAVSPKAPASIEVFETCVHLLSAQIRVSGQNIERYLRFQDLVYLDDLTGLYNTRYLNAVLDREISQFKAMGTVFAILFIDVDCFKILNDSYGHILGSKLLSELGGHLKRQIRQQDTLVRYGGDEFIAVLSGCDLKTADLTSERITESVRSQLFLKQENLNIKVTISIGFALYPDHAQTKQEMIKAADNAMYMSKKQRVSIKING